MKGDWVLIHVGFAMSKISEEDAIDQMRTLTDAGRSEAAMQEVRRLWLGQMLKTRKPREAYQRAQRIGYEICR